MAAYVNCVYPTNPQSRHICVQILVARSGRRLFQTLVLGDLQMKDQKGFSLVELLVVVIIIAIVAAIAIPNLLASRRAANEASAISTLRTYHSAEATYQATTGGSSNYANGSQLTGLVDQNLAADAATKSGYAFTVTAATVNYCATATPSSASTGRRSFAVSNDGVIYAGPIDTAGTGAAALACSGGAVTGAGGANSPI